MEVAIEFAFNIGDYVKPKARKQPDGTWLLPKDYERFKITDRGYMECSTKEGVITAKSYQATFINLKGQTMIGPVDEEKYELINPQKNEAANS